MLFLFSFFTVFYLGFVYFVMKGWDAIPVSEHNENCPEIRISVIVAARNEAQNIRNLLHDLSIQNYAAKLYEVIVIDDASEDGTGEILAEAKNTFEYNLKVLSKIHHSGSPKKEAIEEGVKQSQGELIVITDADCRAGSNWLCQMAGYYKLHDAKFIAGPVKYNVQNNLIGKVLQIEFASLISTAAAAIYFGNPVMCNAANIAFSKSAFTKVDGFKGNEKYVSGDDVFLMQKIHNSFPGGVHFLKHTSALVSTKPVASLADFVHQRIRWASKWSGVGNWRDKILPLFVFGFHAITLIAFITIFYGKLAPGVWIFLFSVKFVMEYLLLKKVMKFYESPCGFGYYLIASLLYPVYAVFFGIAANINTFKWKGRKF